ncbi:hypothetical protein ACFVAV_27475 [Nocardia sp. NPDC057663]|uniref:hypothetical protein n=1 Tax=Nocardia sp. NPDC057663 TaxID=3346201 RepID=UPI00366EA3B7
MITALIAIAGTLLGAAATHYFQRVNADRTVRQNFAERLRQDRLTAYHAFATSVIEYRHEQIERWHRLNRDPDAEANMRSEAYDKKAAVRSQILRIKLLTSDEALIRLAEEAIDASRDIQRSGTGPGAPGEHEGRYLRATAAIDAFVRHAGSGIQNHSAGNLTELR